LQQLESERAVLEALQSDLVEAKTNADNTFPQEKELS